MMSSAPDASLQWARNVLSDQAECTSVCREAFAAGTNGSSRLCVHEVIIRILNICRERGLRLPADEKVPQLVRICDKSGDGKLQLMEFTNAFRCVLESCVHEAEHQTYFPWDLRQTVDVESTGDGKEYWKTSDAKILEEQKATEAKHLEEEEIAKEKRLLEELKAAELKLLEEQNAAEAKFRQEEMAKAKRLVEEQKVAEAKLLEEQQAAEVKHLEKAEMARAKRLQEEQKAAVAKRLEEEVAKAQCLKYEQNAVKEMAFQKEKALSAVGTVSDAVVRKKLETGLDAKLQERVQTRAYFLWRNGMPGTSEEHYFEALRCELQEV